jgi:hypothetical protein
MRFMGGWSWAQYINTPPDVVREIIRQAEEEEAEREARG